MATPVVGIDLGGAHTGTVHQDRLVLAGSVAVSDLILASQVGGDRNRPDFRLGTTTPDPSAMPAIVGNMPVTDPAKPPEGARYPDDPAAGFWLQATSERANTFHAMIQQQGLFVFGDLGEANVPAGAFTPGQVIIRENSWYGTETGRTVLIVGGLVIFIQKGGKDVRYVNWSEQDRKYVAPSLIALSGNLFDEAADMSFAPSRDRRSDTVYVVGRSQNVELDGQLGVLLIRHQEPFFAWSRWRTEGRILGGAAPLGNRVFLVERGGDPDVALSGQVALETLAPDETDDLDGGVDVPIEDDPIVGFPQRRFAGVPDEGAWMEGLTDLDGLLFWYLDKQNETVTCFDRAWAIRTYDPRTPDPDDPGSFLRVTADDPVIRVFAVPSDVTDPAQRRLQRRIQVLRHDGTWRSIPFPNPDPSDAVHRLRLDDEDGRPLHAGRLGMAYERSVETLSWAARKQTGTSTRLRPGRIIEATVDVALPPGLEIPVGDEIERIEELLKAGQVRVDLIPTKRRRIRKLRSPRRVFLDTDNIARCRFGGRAGYRDRIALRVTSDRHVSIAGVAYRVVS